MATKVVPYAQHTATTSGEKVAFSVPAQGLGPSKLVSELHIQPAAGNYSYISLYDVATGIVLKDLFPPPANGKAESWSLISGAGEDGIDATKFGIIFAHAGDKWNLYAVVR
jgi:hypothetical protein